MRRFFIAAILVLIALRAVAGSPSGVPASPASSPLALAGDGGQRVEIEFREVPASEVVAALFRDVLHVPFVTTPAVNADRRSVSVRIEGTEAQARLQVTAYLQGLGYRFVQRDGVDQVSALPPSAPTVPRTVRPVLRYFVYAPLWRDASDLGRTLAPLFPDGRFSAGGVDQVSPPSFAGGGGEAALGSAAGAASVGGPGGFAGGLTGTPGTSTAADSLVFYGTVGDIERLRSVLPEVDTAQAEVMVRASVFEVDTSQTDGSAFNLALGVLRGQLSVGTGVGNLLGAAASVATGGVAAGVAGGVASAAASSISGNYVALSSGNVQAVIQALASDQRFRLVTAPTVRVRSGQSAELIVGQQVPVLGAVAYQGVGSGAVQSVEYKSSGVILSARPYVRRNTIQVDLREEISSFIETTSGVNNTPTLQQRTVTSSFSMEDGVPICIGGLTQSNGGSGFQGFSFLPKLLGSKQTTSSRTDILLILQVVKLTQDGGGPTPDELVARGSVPRPPRPDERAVYGSGPILPAGSRKPL